MLAVLAALNLVKVKQLTCQESVLSHRVVMFVGSMVTAAVIPKAVRPRGGLMLLFDVLLVFFRPVTFTPASRGSCRAGIGLIAPVGCTGRPVHPMVKVLKKTRARLQPRLRVHL